jgi:hypothetical protein
MEIAKAFSWNDVRFAYVTIFPLGFLVMFYLFYRFVPSAREALSQHVVEPLKEHEEVEHKVKVTFSGVVIFFFSLFLLSALAVGLMWLRTDTFTGLAVFAVGAVAILWMVFHVFPIVEDPSKGSFGVGGEKQKLMKSSFIIIVAGILLVLASRGIASTLGWGKYEDLLVVCAGVFLAVLCMRFPSLGEALKKDRWDKIRSRPRL